MWSYLLTAFISRRCVHASFHQWIAEQVTENDRLAGTDSPRFPPDFVAPAGLLAGNWPGEREFLRFVAVMSASSDIAGRVVRRPAPMPQAGIPLESCRRSDAMLLNRRERTSSPAAEA
jgi:hypothetical protein